MSKMVIQRSTEDAQAAFLAQLEECGNIKIAATKAKVGRRTVYDWLEDEAFKAKFKKSFDIGTDLLEDEAQRRAFHGVNKPVYQGGKKVGVVTEYSDTLLIFLLKGRRKDVFADRHEHTGANGEAIKTEMTVNIINTGPEPASSEKEVELS